MNYPESKIARSADGKFAPNQSGESDLSMIAQIMMNDDEASAQRQAADMVSYHRDYGLSRATTPEQLRELRESASRNVSDLYEAGLIDGDEMYRAEQRIKAETMGQADYIEKFGGQDTPAGYQVGDATPYGPVIERVEVSPGVAHVLTDRGHGSTHGGYVLSERLNKRMHAFERADRFYEDDVDAAAVAYALPEQTGLSAQHQRDESRQVLDQFYPERLDRFENYGRG